ncbi:MAG TPA: hypothetical protein VKG92_07235, partial [Flavobacteriales bacterium]|nr:hypothetical protein [Flavobacteriales bacterium]
MKLALSAFIFLSCAAAWGQELPRQKVRGPIWSFHARDTRTYGFNFGALSDVSPDTTNVTTVGVRVEVPGIGLFLFMAPNVNVMLDSARFAADRQFVVDEHIHGLNVSAVGSACDCDTNGLNLSGGGTYFHG